MSRSIDTTPIEDRLRHLQPLVFEPVRRTEREPLFNSLTQEHHYFGYEQPVGEHSRFSDDWQRMYGHPIYFLETFVDPERFRGSIWCGRKDGPPPAWHGRVPRDTSARATGTSAGAPKHAATTAPAVH